MTFSTKQFGPPIEATTASCGDGACAPGEGETAESCPQDCLGYHWYDDRSGHWQCNPPGQPSQVATGACDPICDADGCGDGTCDTLNGETPQSCIADCSRYSCTTSPDCDVLAFPDGCTGTWICSGAICVPQCE